MLNSEKLDKSSMRVKIENLNEITNESEYYRQMKLLAEQKRVEFNVASKKMGLKLIREVYKIECIKIDYQNLKSSRIRASYFCEDGDCSVLVKKNLPAVQRLFALTHELKHHFVDRESIENGKFECGNYNKNKKIEIGAEVFAAEFIFPELEMRQSLADFGITKETITPKKIVEYKKNCGIPISYTFIKKRITWFRLIKNGEYDNVKFQSIEEGLFPNPFKRTKKKSVI